MVNEEIHGNKVFANFNDFLNQGEQQATLKKPLFTNDELKIILNALDYHVRLNIFDNKHEITTNDGNKFISLDALAHWIYDTYHDAYRNLTIKMALDKLVIISKENAFNPFLDLLKSLYWDGIDRLEQLYVILGIVDDDLSCVFVRKWLYEVVAGQFNDADDAFSLDGVLVLQGGEGFGKSSLMKALALHDKFFGGGQTLDIRNKDNVLRALGYPITELAELKTSLKHSGESMKGFISAPVDCVRVPYDREATTRARMTAFVGTVNPTDILDDETGYRRWWIVPLKRRFYEDIEALDARQLLAQIYSDVSQMTQDERKRCFRLTVDELERLKSRCKLYTVTVPAQDEVADILAAAAEKGYMFKRLTVSEFKSIHSNELGRYSTKAIGAALRACGIEEPKTSRDDKGRVGRFYTLPVPWREEH